jgi:hypothetical protein
MNSVWDSEKKSWILYQEGTPQKYVLQVSWSDGISAFLEGGIIDVCRVEVCGTVILQKRFIIPHPSKQVGDFSIKAFPLLEL